MGDASRAPADPARRTQPRQHNPWPCERCGNPITITPGCGHLPRAVAAAALLLIATAWLGLAHWHSDRMLPWALVLVAGAGVIALGLRRRGRTGWRCGACGFASRPRLTPAGTPSVAVAIPTYNNARAIGAVVADCLTAAPDVSLLVIDDGSTDGTGQLAQSAIGAVAAPPGRDVERRVLRHERNRGKGVALLTALRHALASGHSHLITIDGDGQHLAADIPRLRAEIAAHPSAVIVGSRDLGGDNIQNVSRFGRRFSNFWLRVQTGVRLADSQCGLRAYPTAPVLSLGLRGHRFDFEVEVLTVGARAGLPLRSVPVAVHYPPADARVSHFDKLWDNVRISWVNTRLLAGALLWPLGWPVRFARGEAPSRLIRPWTGRSFGGKLGHWIFLSVLRSFGTRPAYLLLYPVALYFTVFRPSSTDGARPFLDLVTGPARGLRRFARAYHQILIFSRCVLDRAVIQILGPEAIAFESHGREHLEATVRGGRGAILLSAHIGNNEVAGALLASRRTEPYEVNVVMLDAEVAAIKSVYERAGHRDPPPKIIAINRGAFPALRILNALRNGEVVAIHGDRVVDDHWVWCDFLGRPAPFPTSAFAIAAAAKVPVILTFSICLGPGRYVMFGEPPREIELPRRERQSALEDHARWFAGRLEHYAQRYPLQWFNFFDFWKRPD